MSLRLLSTENLIGTGTERLSVGQSAFEHEFECFERVLNIYLHGVGVPLVPRLAGSSPRRLKLA
jgi:hypothetical protein